MLWMLVCKLVGRGCVPPKDLHYGGAWYILDDSGQEKRWRNLTEHRARDMWTMHALRWCDDILAMDWDAEMKMLGESFGWGDLSILTAIEVKTRYLEPAGAPT